MIAHSPRVSSMERWYAATAIRRSRRRYDQTPASAPQLEALSTHCDGYHPFGDVRVAFVAKPGLDVFTGVVGSYGKITGAPHVMLIIITDETSPTAQAHAGYVGEAAILEATALGLDTCWVGGFFDPRKAGRVTSLSSGERVVAVTPVGVGVEGYSATEKAMRGMAGAHKRKELDEIAAGWKAWPQWAISAAQCVRIAPSAVNRQPWRLSMNDDGALSIFRDSSMETPKVTKALDCGIAMLHAELGALDAGVAGTWTPLEEKLGVARFTPQEDR